jgi:hypothetical protein
MPQSTVRAADLSLPDEPPFKKGDRVRALKTASGEFTKGSHYTVSDFIGNTVYVAADDAGETNAWGAIHFEYATEDREASELLLLLMGKTNASVDKFGAMKLSISLTTEEADWYFAWAAENDTSGLFDVGSRVLVEVGGDGKEITGTVRSRKFVEDWLYTIELDAPRGALLEVDCCYVDDFAEAAE